MEMRLSSSERLRVKRNTSRMRCYRSVRTRCKLLQSGVQALLLRREMRVLGR